MHSPVSVVLIRENAEQVTGSGCCGKLEGDNTLLGGHDMFVQSRQHQRDVGVLHRAIREFFPPVDGREQVSVITVDPRNQLYLMPKLWRDVWRYRPGLKAGLQAMLQLFSLPAVVVNGRVISRRNRPLDPDMLCHIISEHIRTAEQKTLESRNHGVPGMSRKEP